MHLLTDPLPSRDRSLFQMTVRVGYHETDGQRRVHHANYLNYFEQGRVEMLRAAGLDYRQFENDGLMLVVTEMHVRYRGAAEFDDLLRVTVQVVQLRGVRIRHHYKIDRDGEVLVEADSTIACIDRSGKPRRFPPQWNDLFAQAAQAAQAEANDASEV